MPDRCDAALRALLRGKLVVYPTDTLWGLGAVAKNGPAVERLFEVKHRPRGAPVSVMVSSHEEVEPIARLEGSQRAFLRRELPGPVTVLVRSSPLAQREFSPLLFGPAGRIGVRIPDHPIARELAHRAGPITCTSANLHGERPSGDLGAIRATLGRSVALYLDGSPRPSGRASQIVDLTHGETVVRGA
jgi:L-threonylcarbamoyladenylate synthase